MGWISSTCGNRAYQIISESQSRQITTIHSQEEALNSHLKIKTEQALSETETNTFYWATLSSSNAYIT
jgi:hypothetical protein